MQAEGKTEEYLSSSDGVRVPFAIRMSYRIHDVLASTARDHEL